MIDRNQVREGMVVRSADGRRLGRVIAQDERGFVVEKGFFFLTEYVAAYGDVAQVSGREIRLARALDALEPYARASPRLAAARRDVALVRGGYRLDGVTPQSYGDEGGGGLS